MQRIEVPTSAPLSQRVQGSISELDNNAKFTTGDVFPELENIPKGLSGCLDHMECVVPTGKKINGLNEHKKIFDPRVDGRKKCIRKKCIYASKDCPQYNSATSEQI